MRRRIYKFVPLLITASMLLLGACGYKEAVEELSHEEEIQQYVTSVDEIMEEIYVNDTAALEVDYSDNEKVREFAEGSKAIYEKLMALNAPEEFSDAQEELNTGAQKMIEYYDMLPEHMKTGVDDEDARNALITVYSQGIQAISEGYNQVEAAKKAADDTADAAS